MINKRGQVWIETVLYTLVAISLIALVLAFVTPKVNQERDKGVVEQTINSLNMIDKKVNEVLSAPGNVRIAEVTVKKGIFYIDSDDDVEEIGFILTGLSKPYSEPGIPIQIGRVNIISSVENGQNMVNLNVTYDKTAIDLLNNEEGGSDPNIKKDFSSASLPYRLSITHTGFTTGNDKKIKVNFVDMNN